MALIFLLPMRISLMEILLVVNTVLGCFAGFANGYYALQTRQMRRRLPRLGLTVLSVYTGMTYAAALLGYIPNELLGPLFLRPVIMLLLILLAAIPFIDRSDGLQYLERQVEEMQARIHQQDAEIQRLNDVIQVLVRQFVDMEPAAPISRSMEATIPPMILVAGVEADKLDVRDEVDGIFDSGMIYEYLAPPVSRNRLIAELDRLRPPALHLLGHMTTKGMMLADGFASVGWWRRLLRRYHLQFVFANGCESLDIVDALHVEGAQCVIGMRRSVTDAAALEFSRQLYHWLAAGRSAQEAVDLAKLSLGHEDAEQVVIRGDWRYEG